MGLRDSSGTLGGLDIPSCAGDLLGPSMTMRRNAVKVALNAAPSERRRLPRKEALLGAVVADVDGETASDCVIRDINARSAQISFSRTLPIGSQIYLLDANNKAAYLARVVWGRSGRTGLLFIESHAIGLGLPPKLKFLWRLFLEAKLREVYRLVATGIPLELALSTAGLAEEHLHQMARYASVEKRTEILLRLAKRVMKRWPRKIKDRCVHGPIAFDG